MGPRSRRRPNTRGRLRAPLLACAGLFIAGAARGQESLEIAVKAAYLYKFAPFVGWPAAALGGPADPFAICVVGADPFGAVLDRAVAGQQVAGRPIVVRRFAQAARAQPCQIAYLGVARGQSGKEALRVLRGAPVLTVTDASAARGMIDLVISEGRVRFRIDDAAAADSGLTISSKLLSLALSVTPRKAQTGQP